MIITKEGVSIGTSSFLSEYYVAKTMLIGMQKINHEKHEAAIKNRHANEAKRNMGQVKDGNAKKKTDRHTAATIIHIAIA